MRGLLLATTGIAACFAASSAFAQAAPADAAAAPPPATAASQPGSQAEVAPSTPPPAQDSTQSSTGVADIVVTAQRRSENLQRAAIPVSAVSGLTLSQANVTAPAELTKLVPALQITSGGGPYSLFYLRGVGNFTANALSDPAVAFNFNGEYIAKTAGTNGFFYDLERVEVLKGPQGTLYGRNATGGAVNVITHKPEFDAVSGYAQGEYGNYDYGRFEGALNLPVSDTVAIRMAGTYVGHNGYMTDGATSQSEGGGRVSVRYKPSDKLEVNVVADYYLQGGRGSGSTVAELGLKNRVGLTSPAAQAFYQQQPNLVLGRTFAPLTVLPYQDNEFYGVLATIDYQTPIGTLTVEPAFRHVNLDFGTTAPGYLLRYKESDSQQSVEARLASGTDHPLRYLAGFYYYNEDNDVPFFLVNQQSNFNLDDYTAGAHSYAGFGQLTYAIVPSVRISGGLRYTSEHRYLDGTLLGAIRACTRPTTYFPTYTPGCPNAPAFPYSQVTQPTPGFDFVSGAITTNYSINRTGANRNEADFHKLTYRVAADWDVTPRNLLYASYETGFKSGGFYFTSDNGTFQPERIQAWTIGSKNRFLDNKLQANIEAFYWRYRDQQISHLILDSLGNAVFATQNVGRATFKGVEVELEARPLVNTTLSADVQYLDAVYDQFVYNSPNLNGGLGNGTGCPNAGAPTTVYVVNCSGFRPPNAPKWTINLGGSQTIPLGNNKLVFDARAHHQTTTLVGQEFTANEYQKAYWTADADLSLHLRGDHLTIGAFVNNAFNETVVSLSQPIAFGLFNTYTLRPPRTYGVRAGVRF